MVDLQCQSCGWCCENIVINVAHSDILRWLAQQRYDILKEISFLDNYPKKGTGGFYIRETVLNPKRSCPFLRYNDKLSSCAIHKTKPLACKDAPLGYDSFPNCPAFDSNIVNEEIRTQIRVSQHEDFKLAYTNQGQLLTILTKTRRKY